MIWHMEQKIIKVILRSCHYWSICTHGIRRGLRSLLSNQAPVQYSSPSNSGLQGTPFQSLYITLCRKFKPLFYKQPLFMAIPHFFIVFPNSLLLGRLFQQCDPNKIPEKHKNKLMWQSCFFIFRKLRKHIRPPL